MEALRLPFKKLTEDAVVPENAYKGDAGIDLRSVEDVVLRPFERKLVRTGLAVAIPAGYAGFVMPRSGNALRMGLSLVNTPGLVDSNYRGELKCILVNLDAHEDIHVHVGDRVAQMVIMRVEDVSAVQVDVLDSTERGEKGFGSSGVR